MHRTINSTTLTPHFPVSFLLLHSLSLSSFLLHSTLVTFRPVCCLVGLIHISFFSSLSFIYIMLLSSQVLVVSFLPLVLISFLTSSLSLVHSGFYFQSITASTSSSSSSLSGLSNPFHRSLQNEHPKGKSVCISTDFRGYLHLNSHRIRGVLVRPTNLCGCRVLLQTYTVVRTRPGGGKHFRNSTTVLREWVRSEGIDRGYKGLPITNSMWSNQIKEGKAGVIINSCMFFCPLLLIEAYFLDLRVRVKKRVGCNCSSVNNVVKQAADLIHDAVVGGGGRRRPQRTDDCVIYKKALALAMGLASCLCTARARADVNCRPSTQLAGREDGKEKKSNKTNKGCLFFFEGLHVNCI
ncbi:hypothetical protein VP01_2512g1 [Puccinia sorghi]|uniref:Uncharacterized protein n=1 Tax=Puccinia sorghi TaxID=27349 RepID=A0A0L6V5G3_9BASI|nr:hypothetical protein VP01_2512g1 [Puccinia sorghi]